jgi:hypothetical protein
MAKSISPGVVIAIVVFVAIAAAIKFFGGELYGVLLSLHGTGGGH